MTFNHPELTNCTLSGELPFDIPLVANTEILFTLEHASFACLTVERWL